MNFFVSYTCLLSEAEKKETVAWTFIKLLMYIYTYSILYIDTKYREDMVRAGSEILGARGENKTILNRNKNKLQY